MTIAGNETMQMIRNEQLDYPAESTASTADEFCRLAF